MPVAASVAVLAQPKSPAASAAVRGMVRLVQVAEEAIHFGHTGFVPVPRRDGAVGVEQARLRIGGIGRQGG